MLLWSLKSWLTTYILTDLITNIIHVDVTSTVFCHLSKCQVFYIEFWSHMKCYQYHLLTSFKMPSLKKNIFAFCRYMKCCNFEKIILSSTWFTKLHMGSMILVKIMSVLNNFLLQNTNLVSVLSKICPNKCYQYHLLTSFKMPSLKKIFLLSVVTWSVVTSIASYNL
jgi:hypothetical protein